MLLTLMLGCPPAAESGKAEPAESVKTVDTAADSVGCVAEMEVCDREDNDCDGAVDEEAADAVEFYADGDGDGYGEDATVAMGCTVPVGYVEAGGDCEDRDAAIHPGAAEICGDGIAQSCGTEPCRRSGEYTLEDADSYVEEECMECWIYPQGTGDIDGDGRNEVLFNGQSIMEDGNKVGNIYLMHGDDLKNLADAPIKIRGEFDEQHIVYTSSFIGDIDGDSLEDIATMKYAEGDYLDDDNYLFFTTNIQNTTSTNEIFSKIITFVSPISFNEKQGDMTGDGRADISLLSAYEIDDESMNILGFSNFTEEDQTTLDYTFNISYPAIGSYKRHDSSHDINGDGMDDMVFSISDYERTNGGIFTLYGPLQGNYLLTDADAVFLGEVQGDEAGQQISSIGDIDMDGYGDIAISSEANGGMASYGSVYIVSGNTQGTQSLSSAEYIIVGGNADEAISDSCLRRAGDTDGDGREDLIVSGRMPGISYMYIFYDFEKGTMISSESYGFKIIGGYCGPTSDINSDGLTDISMSTASMIAWPGIEIAGTYFFNGLEF